MRAVKRVPLTGLHAPQSDYLAAGRHEAVMETILLTTGRAEHFGLAHYCR